MQTDLSSRAGEWETRGWVDGISQRVDLETREENGNDHEDGDDDEAINQISRKNLC